MGNSDYHSGVLLVRGGKAIDFLKTNEEEAERNKGCRQVERRVYAVATQFSCSSKCTCAPACP